MKSALFAGSFDPPTFGHLNIIERASAMFDSLFIGIAINHSKQPLLTAEEKVSLLKELTQKYPNVKIASYEGLTAQFAKRHNIDYLIRSSRSGSDYLLEWDMARSNYHLGQIETLIIPADEKYAHIRSAIVREIAANKGDLKEFVPLVVEKALYKN